MNLQTLFLREKSFEGYDDNAVLECLLTSAGIRTDIPGMIDRLMDEFGSFKAVLEAKPVQLMKVPGVSKKTATLISMIVPLARVWERTSMKDQERIGNCRDAEAYCKSLLMGERVEKFYVIALNAQCKVLGVRKISDGSLSEVSAYPRMVAETALNYNAHSVLCAHCHPGGTCSPSMEDIQSTIQLQRMLKTMNILLLDHIIVANSSTYSMVSHGDIDYRVRGAA